MRYEDERQALVRYLRDIRNIPVLSREEENSLVERIERGDPEARASLIESNLGFVVRVAKEYRSLGVPFEDLLSEGNLGLIEAARRFDRTRGTKFITYAIWWIRKTILRALADRSLVVRVPSHSRRKLLEFRRTESDLRVRLGRSPTREEIARHLSVSEAKVDRLRGLHLANVSLDKAAREGDSTPMLDFLSDEDATAEERLLSNEAGEHVTRAFRRLTTREQAILGWRYALDGQPPLTLKQVGARLGLSRERVRQIEAEAKRRLRRWLAVSMRSRDGLDGAPDQRE